MGEEGSGLGGEQTTWAGSPAWVPCWWPGGAGSSGGRVGLPDHAEALPKGAGLLGCCDLGPRSLGSREGETTVLPAGLSPQPSIRQSRKGGCVSAPQPWFLVFETSTPSLSHGYLPETRTLGGATRITPPGHRPPLGPQPQRPHSQGHPSQGHQPSPSQSLLPRGHALWVTPSPKAARVPWVTPFSTVTPPESHPCPKVKASPVVTPTPRSHPWLTPSQLADLIHVCLHHHSGH